MQEKKIKTKNKNQRRGFTVIEMIVSTALFVTVFVAVSGSLISVLDSYQKVTASRINLDNLATTIESMVRGMKTGDLYHCGAGVLTEPKDCVSGDTLVAFTNPNVPRPFGTNPDLPIVYKFESGMLQRSDDGGINYYPLTIGPPTLTIDYARFYVWGSVPFRPIDVVRDTRQPLITIVVKGTVQVKDKLRSPFSMQTTLVQRRLDIEY